jgi:hypothetical protein
MAPLWVDFLKPVKNVGAVVEPARMKSPARYQSRMGGSRNALGRLLRGRLDDLERIPYLLVTTAPPVNPAATNDIRPLKPLWNIAQPWIWLWWMVPLLVAAILIYYLWRRRRARPAELTPEVVIPPHERAWARLQKALELIGQPKPFTIEVSDAVRFYLEERFNFRAPERTTEEFLNELQSTPRLSASQKQSLAVFLERCDLVKFARYEPGLSELKQLHEAALQLVRETTPIAVANPAPAPVPAPQP